MGDRKRGITLTSEHLLLGEATFELVRRHTQLTHALGSHPPAEISWSPYSFETVFHPSGFEFSFSMPGVFDVHAVGRVSWSAFV
jgi:hypothetical protein